MINWVIIMFPSYSYVSKLIRISKFIIVFPSYVSKLNITDHCSALTRKVLILNSSGQRVHAISEQWHHTHEDNCWVVDESDILKLMPQM